MKPPIKVLIADNYSVVRKGLVALLNTVSEIDVVAEAEDGLKAVKKAQEVQPDVIVMELMMPGLNGIQVIEAIKQSNPLTHFLILTNFGEAKLVREALRAGVHGYLLKDAFLSDVIDAIRDVYAGKLVLHPSITHVLIDAIHNHKQNGLDA